MLGPVGQRRWAGGAGFAQQLKDVAAGELAGVVIGGGVAFSVEPRPTTRTGKRDMRDIIGRAWRPPARRTGLSRAARSALWESREATEERQKQDRNKARN